MADNWELLDEYKEEVLFGVKMKFIVNKTTKKEEALIKKGAKGEIVKEINMRLMGFGGGIPRDEYNDYTVKVVKQFKTDYMKQSNVDGTFVDMDTIEAIDKFTEEYPITETEFNQMKCSCKQCNGFGNELKEPPKNFLLGQQKLNEWKNSKVESNNPYEYQGMHIALIWIYKAAKFYLKRNNYKINEITAGYRCWYDNVNKKRKTVNHFGKAMDITITNLKGDRIVDENLDENVRKKIFRDIMGATIGWSSNKIGLEPRFDSKGNKYAPTWIHYDVREITKALTKDFFTEEKEEILNPKKLKKIVKN